MIEVGGDIYGWLPNERRANSILDCRCHRAWRIGGLLTALAKLLFHHGDDANTNAPGHVMQGREQRFSQHLRSAFLYDRDVRGARSKNGPRRRDRRRASAAFDHRDGTERRSSLPRATPPLGLVERSEFVRPSSNLAPAMPWFFTPMVCSAAAMEIKPGLTADATGRNARSIRARRRNTFDANVGNQSRQPKVRAHFRTISRRGRGPADLAKKLFSFR